MSSSVVMEKTNAVWAPIIFLLLLVSACDSEGAALAPALFVFGDSLIDDGNNNYIPSLARANYMPYGIDFGVPTGRFSNGLTVLDYGAQYLGLPYVPAYLSPSSRSGKTLQGFNYASAAAGILNDSGRQYGARVTFNGQIALFKDTVKELLPLLIPNLKKLSLLLAKSIFIINVGSNDYINNYLLPDIYLSSRTYTGNAFADLLIRNYSRQIKKLYRLGARKIVVVGLGPLGCIPSQLSRVNGNGSCVEEVNALVSAFNERLLPMVNSLNATLPGSFFVFQNTYNTFSDMIANPFKYGFTVTNKACCGCGKYGGRITCLPLQSPCTNRNQYIFWDSFHPTQAANAILAERCYSKTGTDCYPINIYQLAQI